MLNSVLKGKRLNSTTSLGQPPVFGATAALVLQNIGRSDEGERLLKPVTDNLIAALLKNENVAAYIGDLLVILDAENEENLKDK